MADGGWENALSTQLLATHCVFCAHPLRDPESVELGYGPECAANHWKPRGVPQDVNEADAERAFLMAPPGLRKRWEQIGGRAEDKDAAWRHEPETRRQMISVGLHIGALAVSFGADGVETVRAKIDSAKQCLAALQQFALAAGYDACSDRLRNKYVERLKGNLIIFKRSEKAGFLGVHVPYSVQWRDWSRGHSHYFVHSQYEEGRTFYFRFFSEKNLGEIANALSGCFGDTIAIDPDGKLVPLPSMSIEAEKPAPAENVTAANVEVIEEVTSYAVPDKIKLGDMLKLPDGRELPVLYIDPTKQFVGVGKKQHGRGYELFLSFAQVKQVSGREVAKELYAAIAKYSEETKQPGAVVMPSVRATARSIPVLSDGQTLDPHQVTGVQFIDEHGGRVLLADEMGLGKTVTAIVALDTPAVVVCPSNLKVNWNREVMKWHPSLTVSIIQGGAEPSSTAQRADVVIINYEIVEKHITWLTARKNVTIVADEAHYLKNMDVRFDKATSRYEVKPPPARAAAFYELQRGVPRLILMTGTPIMNRTKEIFPHLHMLNPGEWSNGFNFCEVYCGGHYEQFGPRRVYVCDGRTNSEELFGRINNKYMLRRTVDVLNLPPKRYEPKTVSLDEDSAKKYQEQVKAFLDWVDRNGGPEAVLRAERAEALVQLNKLRETCAEGKAEAAVEHIKEHWVSTGQPLVVMANYKTVFKRLEAGVEALNAEYKAQKKARETPDMQAPIRYASIVGGMGSDKVMEIVDKLQRGELDVVFYSIALAVGTTLTAARDMLFVERAWRPADLAQAEARIFRRGQENKCCFTYLDAAGTVDEKIAMLLKQKAGTIAAVIYGVNLDEEDAAALVLGEMFGVGGVTRNPGATTAEQVSDSWGSPL